MDLRPGECLGGLIDAADLTLVTCTELAKSYEAMSHVCTMA